VCGFEDGFSRFIKPPNSEDFPKKFRLRIGSVPFYITPNKKTNNLHKYVCTQHTHEE
jgi:hypothetical protein